MGWREFRAVGMPVIFATCGNAVGDAALASPWHGRDPLRGLLPRHVGLVPGDAGCARDEIAIWRPNRDFVGVGGGSMNDEIAIQRVDRDFVGEGPAWPSSSGDESVRLGRGRGGWSGGLTP